MTRQILFALITFVFCVPCFAEDLPSVPELLKRMYDYRMAIDNMRAEVTVTEPVDTQQRHRETGTQHFFFAYDKGRVRCDRTYSNPKFSTKLYQYLSTSDFYYTRYPSPENPQINDGNNLVFWNPLAEQLDLFDLRGIGLNHASFDAIAWVPFSFDTILDGFYNPKGEGFSVNIDLSDGERLYKVSYQIDKGVILNSYWINPQKGYNLVRWESESKALDRYSVYTITLGKFSARGGEIWFPQLILYKYRMKNDISEEKIVVDSVAFDVQDEIPFTLAGLDIPVGYRIDYHGEKKYWDGKELVDKIPYVFEPVSVKDRKIFWIVNGIGFALIALAILYRWIKMLQRRSI